MAGLDPAIHDFLRHTKDVDARHKAGHDGEIWLPRAVAISSQLILLGHGSFALTPCEPSHRHSPPAHMGTVMADRSGLKLVGFIFATVTLAVMLVTGMVVKGHADGAYSLDGTSVATRTVIVR
jgi:hypothetical protein